MGCNRHISKGQRSKVSKRMLPEVEVEVLESGLTGTNSKLFQQHWAFSGRQFRRARVAFLETDLMQPETMTVFVQASEGEGWTKLLLLTVCSSYTESQG